MALRVNFLYANVSRYIGTCFRFYTQMRVEKKSKAFAYRVPIGDYNYLQCMCTKLFLWLWWQCQKSFLNCAAAATKGSSHMSWHPWDPWGRVNSRVWRFVFDFSSCQLHLANFFRTDEHDPNTAATPSPKKRWSSHSLDRQKQVCSQKIYCACLCSFVPEIVWSC